MRTGLVRKIKRRLVNRFTPPVEAEIMESDYPTLNSPVDYDLSPYTGWTRQHWDELATLILRGVLGFFSPGRAGVHVPGSKTSKAPRVEGLEGFARSLGIAVPWVVSRGDGKILRGTDAIDLLDYYQTGIVHGTNPTHQEYWGDISNNDQRIVEAGEIAWSLYIARSFLWDPLSAVEKDQIAGWLAQVNGKRVKLNNWVLFKVMVNLVLWALGRPHSEQEIQKGLEIAEDFYVGDGWYQDGLSQTSFDSYVAWVFHDYLLKFALIDPPPGFLDVQSCLKRTRRFLQDHQYFFASDGSHPCFGRSQAYRAAVTAPIVLSILANESPLAPGLSRRIASGSLKFFLSRGMLSKRGNLTLGFTRTFLPVLEGYICGGSVYFMSKAFYALLLPPEHSFWTVVEEPLPVEQQDYSIAIPVGGLLLDGEKRGGQVQLINHKSVDTGIEKCQKKYGNFAYSSHFGYEAMIRRGQCNYDSTMLVSADGETFYARRKPFHLHTRPGFGASFFLPFGGTRTIVYTNTILCNHFQIRVHWLVSGRAVEVVEGGYALGYEEGTPTIVSGPDWEFATHGARGTFIRRLVGYDYNIPANGFGGTSEGNNVLYRYSVAPGVGLSHGDYCHILLVSLVRGCVNGERPEELADFVQDVQRGLGWVVMRLQNGDAIFTQLGSIRDKTIQLNGVKVSGRTMFARVSEAGQIVAHYFG